MTNAKYNGWTNYETWVLKLWFDNDEGTQNYWMEQAADIREKVESSYEWQTKEQAEIAELANVLEDDMDEMAEQFMGNQASPLADIMNAGLSRINWREIAESIMETYLESA